MIRENLQRVEERIARACSRSGRQRRDVTLLAVTKIFGTEVIQEAYEAGLREFGENYVQEFAGKAPVVGSLEGARFHLIGHLQSNKAKTAAEIFQVIQTVDSSKLAQRLGSMGKPLEVMIEVKLSPENTKAGIDPEHVPALVDAIQAETNLTLLGLMTMPPWSDDPEVSRPYFARLRDLGSALRLNCLSMGMSHDFEAAIEEGSTHIRVGTALFGKRRKA